MNNYYVYMHVNKTNGKRYIGITNNIQNRWRNGEGYLSGVFREAIRKYGWDGFEHIILHTDLSKDDACALEKKYISQYKTNIYRHGNASGYNLTDGGEGVFGSYNKSGESNPFYGKKHSQESIDKMRKSRVGLNSGTDNHNYGVALSDETKNKLSDSLTHWYSHHKCVTRKPVYCVTDGMSFESVGDAAKYYGISTGLISACCCGNALTTHGKQFTYSADFKLPIYKGSYSTTKKSRSNNLKQRANATPVICVETGDLFCSQKAAADFAKVKDTRHIRKCCVDTNKTSGGYHWRYAE